MRYRTHVVMFSGGIGSWGAARRMADRQGTDGMVLLFADTLIEDPDLYRFLGEAAANIGVPVTRIADGRTPWQVFRDERFLGNSRVDPCSRVLKRELLRRWLGENCDPAATTVVLGFDWTEAHRHERALRYWAPWRVESPLIDPPYRTKGDLLTDLRRDGISPPRLYELGFPHNNCGGGCVKAGQTQFLMLYRTLPEVYADWERHEEELRAELGDVSILRDRTDGDTRPLTLRALRERIESGASIPMFDFGGCACMEPPTQEDR